MFARSTNLQDMCLVAIVRDIDLFVYNKTIPQRHVSFLFKAYADELFAKHKILKEFINEDCMVWFLNPHVKNVTLPPAFTSERVIQQLKTIGPGITSLNLHKSDISESDLNSIICCLPHIVHLDLSETSCSNETLACICKFCRELESLNVSFCDAVTDYGMKILCDSKLSLKSLNISYSGSENTGKALILNRIPSLECVKCDELISMLYEIGRNKTYNLTELVHDDMLDDPMKTIKACIRMCPNLQKLHFEYPVKENVLKACVCFQNLEELKIKSSRVFYIPGTIYNVLTPILPISKKLKTLILSSVEISVLTLIEHFSNLKNLYLKKVFFTPVEKENINIKETNLSTLVIKNMDLEVNDVNYEAVSLLISLSKNVTKLHLFRIHPLPPEIFDVILASMNNLTSVDFSYSNLTIDSLNRLFGIASLTTITANCYEDPEGISDLLPKRTLCTLSWRIMYDGECDENYDVYDGADDDFKHFYLDDSEKSDGSYSPDTESDDNSLYGCEFDIDELFNGSPYDPYDWFGYDPY